MVFMNNFKNFKYLTNAIISPVIRRKICYIHIPKCGGISIKNSITSLYGLRSYLSPGHVFHLDAAASVKSATKVEMDLSDYRKNLLHYALSSKAKFISGHFPLGEDVLNTYGDNWEFITMLRDPVKRWISNFYYNKFNKNPNHVWRIEETLEEFIHTKSAVAYGNNYVNQILGRPYNSGDVTNDDVQKAIQLLEQFSVVGILEEMEKFTEHFKNKFGVKLKLAKENSSPVKDIERPEVSNETMAAIQKLCEPNLAIYSHFSSKLQKQE
jgi:hypothetical protein